MKALALHALHNQIVRGSARLHVQLLSTTLRRPQRSTQNLKGRFWLGHGVELPVGAPELCGRQGWEVPQRPHRKGRGGLRSSGLGPFGPRPWGAPQSSSTPIKLCKEGLKLTKPLESWQLCFSTAHRPDETLHLQGVKVLGGFGA